MPENTEAEKQEATSSDEQKLSPVVLMNEFDGMPVTDPPISPASPSSVNKMESLSIVDQQEQSPCQDHHSPLSLSVDAQESYTAVDIEARLLPHSEDEEDEDDDEPMKGEQHNEDTNQELHEHGVKPELLLDEMSNLSHGDESSSGFLGSPGEPDPQLSMELGFVPSGRSDNLLTETDDSLPFEPLRSDGEKGKRRGSPGRSRVKQVYLLLYIWYKIFLD